MLVPSFASLISLVWSSVTYQGAYSGVPGSNTIFANDPSGSTWLEQSILVQYGNPAQNSPATFPQAPFTYKLDFYSYPFPSGCVAIELVSSVGTNTDLQYSLHVHNNGGDTLASSTWTTPNGTESGYYGLPKDRFCSGFYPRAAVIVNPNGGTLSSVIANVFFPNGDTAIPSSQWGTSVGYYFRGINIQCPQNLQGNTAVEVIDFSQLC